MKIKYSDGRAVEALLLSRTESTLRGAVEGAGDVMEFSQINGTWVSADCEPVRIEFDWLRHDRKPAISEADCCCSPELAARLIHSLFTGSSEDGMEGDAACNEEFGLAGSSGMLGTESTAARVPRCRPC
jgi:hypothetical protein